MIEYVLEIAISGCPTLENQFCNLTRNISARNASPDVELVILIRDRGLLTKWSGNCLS